MRLPNPYATPLLTVESAGVFLGLGRRASYRAAGAGSLPTARIGGHLMVRTADLYGVLGLPIPAPAASPVVAR